MVAHSAHLPREFRRSLRYICLDRRQAAGAEKGLAENDEMPMVDRAAASGLPLQAFVGCVLSNEFLDSFPVHQVTVRQGCLREVYVGLRGEELVEIIGEAANRVSPEARSEISALPWTQIIGMRNVLVHVYFDFDLETLWKTVTHDLPALRVTLERIDFPAEE